MAAIPLSWNDPLFSGVTSSGSVMLKNGGTISYKSIVDNTGDAVRNDRRQRLVHPRPRPY